MQNKKAKTNKACTLGATREKHLIGAPLVGGAGRHVGSLKVRLQSCLQHWERLEIGHSACALEQFTYVFESRTGCKLVRRTIKTSPLHTCWSCLPKTPSAASPKTSAFHSCRNSGHLRTIVMKSVSNSCSVENIAPCDGRWHGATAQWVRYATLPFFATLPPSPALSLLSSLCCWFFSCQGV